MDFRATGVTGVEVLNTGSCDVFVVHLSNGTQVHIGVGQGIVGDDEAVVSVVNAELFAAGELEPLVTMIFDPASLR